MADTQKGPIMEQDAIYKDVVVQSGTDLKQQRSVPRQFIEMNENMRELVITPSMRQQDVATKQSQDKDKTGSSALSHTTKGFMGNTPVQLGHNLPGTEMTNQ